MLMFSESIHKDIPRVKIRICNAMEGRESFIESITICIHFNEAIAQVSVVGVKESADMCVKRHTLLDILRFPAVFQEGREAMVNGR